MSVSNRPFLGFTFKMTQEQLDIKLAAARREVRDIVEEHQPSIGVGIDDSTWLECSCGWEQDRKPFVSWVDHLTGTIDSATAVPGADPTTVEDASTSTDIDPGA